MLKTMSQCDLAHRRVMIREDFNVPFTPLGEIRSDARLRAAIPTLQEALKKGARLLLLSHCGRPEEGKEDPRYSLEPVARRLSELLQHPVRFEKNWLEGVTLEPHEVVLCENVRFNKGETENDEALSKKIAALCDIFVMDAFACAHRAQASTEGVARFAKEAVAGPLLMGEIEALSRVLSQPVSPVVAIVGGSKVSTKLSILHALLKPVDYLIVGGGIANTFLAAQGFPVGASLCEPDLIPEALQLLKEAKEQGTEILIPQDVMVATAFDPHAQAFLRNCDEIKEGEMILDIGPRTIQQYETIIQSAKTILWNGPVGVFEFDAFQEGTGALARAIAHSTGFSVAGGGDTLAAIELFDVEKEISYISTGGGAFLEYLEGRSLPAIEILQQRSGSR